MVQIDVDRLLGDTWAHFKKNWLRFSLLFLAYSLLVYLVSMLSAPDEVTMAAIARAAANQDQVTLSEIYMQELFSWKMLVQLVFAVILMSVFSVVFVRVALRACRGEAEITLDNVVSAFRVPVNAYLRVIGVNIIVSILTSLGCYMCILPGLFLWARLMLATTLVIDNPEMGVFEAIGRSWQMTKGNSFSLTMVTIAAVFICIAGLCLCCVGIIPAAAYVYLLPVVAYLILSQDETEPSN